TLALALVATACSSGTRASCEGVAINVGLCTCDQAQAPIRPVTECSSTTMGTANLLCCNGATACTCTRIECAPLSSDSCACNFAQTGASECTGTYCCNATGNTAGQCNCGPNPCILTGEVQVPKCSVSALECQPGQTRVDKCLPR